LKNKITYSLVLLLSFFIVHTQTKQFELMQGNCQLFNGHVYSFGLKDQKQNAAFCVYKMDFKLRILDTVRVDPGKGPAENYLQTYSDTLHDCLNIYLQKKEKKTVTILRFNKKFELLAKIENVDIARLNNTAMFSSELFYFKNFAYSVKTINDSSGRQFYLNKYALKSDLENFDYALKWQFPFERKNVHSAHIFYANKNFVFLFAMVTGDKTGQWVLKIGAETGKLIKATKLNNKDETNIYIFGDCYADKSNKTISLVGQKYTESQYNPEQNKLTLSNALLSTLYYVEIDSLGEIIVRQDFKLPINDIKTGVKKTANNYILRISKLKKGPDGSFAMTCDVFKSMNSNLCYLYANTFVFNLLPEEDRLIPEKNAIAPNLMIEQYYATPDRLDMNGKICIDSLDQFQKLFYKSFSFPVKQHFKYDGEKNPIWIVSKHTTKKNNVNFSFLGPVKKIYTLTTIEDIVELLNPVFTGLSNENFLISSQIEEKKYQLKLYNW